MRKIVSKQRPPVAAASPPAMLPVPATNSARAKCPQSTARYSVAAAAAVLILCETGQESCSVRFALTVLNPALAAAILDVSGAFAGEAIRFLILFAVRPRHRASEARGTSGQVRKAIFPLLLPPVCGAALRVGPKRQLRALEVALGCEPPVLAPWIASFPAGAPNARAARRLSAAQLTGEFR